MSYSRVRARQRRSTRVRASISGGADADPGLVGRRAAAGSAGRSTALALLLAIIAPSPIIASFMSPYTDWTSLLFNPIGTFVLLAIGLNIVVGHAGLLDLGYVAFYAIGAYTLAYLGTEHGFRSGRRWSWGSSWPWCPG